MRIHSGVELFNETVAEGQTFESNLVDCTGGSKLGLQFDWSSTSPTASVEILVSIDRSNFVTLDGSYRTITDDSGTKIFSISEINFDFFKVRVISTIGTVQARCRYTLKSTN